MSREALSLRDVQQQLQKAQAALFWLDHEDCSANAFVYVGDNEDHKKLYQNALTYVMVRSLETPELGPEMTAVPLCVPGVEYQVHDRLEARLQDSGFEKLGIIDNYFTDVLGLAYDVGFCADKPQWPGMQYITPEKALQKAAQWQMGNRPDEEKIKKPMREFYQNRMNMLTTLRDTAMEKIAAMHLRG